MTTITSAADLAAEQVAEPGRQQRQRQQERAQRQPPDLKAPATRLVSDTSVVGISQWPVVVRNEIVAELGQLAGAEQRLVADQIGHRDLGVAVLARSAGRA